MKKTNLFLNTTLGFLIKIYAIIKKQKIIKKCKIKGPAIVLSNHTSFYDFIYTHAALYPHRVTYLAASKMFYEPLTGFFLRLARAIPKHLMQPDPVSTLNAFRILKKNGIVSIFPEGQISPSGRSLTPSFSIAKMIKKANVDVYIVKHMGAGLSNPPWSKNTFKGRVDTIKELIILKAELTNLSENEIYQIIVQNLYHSSSAYNKEKRYTYKLNDISNLENVIYQCPKCLHEGLTSNGHQLMCPSCHHELTYDQYGLLNGRGIDDLFGEQEQRVQHEINASNDYQIQGSTKLMSFRGNRLVEVGKGILTIQNDEYIYQGTVDQRIQTLKFHVKNTQSLPSDIGRNVQIYEQNQIYQFEMEIPWLPTKMVHVGEYLHIKWIKSQHHESIKS